MSEVCWALRILDHTVVGHIEGTQLIQVRSSIQTFAKQLKLKARVFTLICKQIHVAKDQISRGTIESISVERDCSRESCLCCMRDRTRVDLPNEG